METILVNGFLDAGKTTYIQDCILHDFFHKYGSTLILCFESGEISFDEAVLAQKNTKVVYYEGGEDITAFCTRCIAEHSPDRIYVEMNAMLPNLRTSLPDVMEIAFVTTLIDFRTLAPYMNNLRQYINDMVKESATVTFLHCDSKDALSSYSQIFKLMNPKASYLWQDPVMGYHKKAFDMFLPYSLEEPLIRIDENTYLMFCLDALNNPEHYAGKNLEFLLPLEVRDRADLERRGASEGEERRGSLEEERRGASEGKDCSESSEEERCGASEGEERCGSLEEDQRASEGREQDALQTEKRSTSDREELRVSQPKEVICGRTVMTCCMADIQFMGAVLRPGHMDPPSGGWILLKARGDILSGTYGQKRLSLLTDEATPIAPPSSIIMMAQ